MKLLTITLLALAALTAPALAACQNYPIVTPDTAPVARVGYSNGGSGGGALAGTAYTMATFCPVASAPGNCTGQSIVGPVTYTAKVNYTTFDGIVPDGVQHKLGFNSPIAIPALNVVVGFNPVGGFIPGAC